jgi:hypothetical protein
MHVKMPKKAPIRVRNMDNVIVLLEKTAITWYLRGAENDLVAQSEPAKLK